MLAGCWSFPHQVDEGVSVHCVLDCPVAAAAAVISSHRVSLPGVEFVSHSSWWDPSTCREKKKKVILNDSACVSDY
jgi:hypothetical protein